ncbi:MAG: hypothetical protein K2G38_05330 [Clostridia bacterium]|nr:hypothetical protein [Clostridia bacterium]
MQKSKQTDALIAQCLDELKGIAHFRYTYKCFEAAPEFLKRAPYAEYLKGSSGLFIAVMTLGAEADAKIKLYSRTDAAKAIVFDACASAYLEYLSDEYEKGLGDNLSYRFCVGYGGSDISDLKYIFDIVKPEKIGVTLTSANYMLPSKSMAGIIAVGNGAEKSCKNCVIATHCEYLKRGEKCFR